MQEMLDRQSDEPVRSSRPAPTQRLDPRAVRAWRVAGALWTLLLLLIAAGPIALATWRDWGWPWIVVPLAFVGAVGVLLIGIVPAVRWRRWCYLVSERDIDLQRGLLVVTRTLVPMTRVQHVDTRQGPILRHYGLATVEVATAAGTQEIPALAVDAAEALRDQIAALAGVAEDV